MRTKTGEISLVMGPMYSGKTTEVLASLRWYLLAGRRCLLVKYSKDARYATDEVVTHEGVRSSEMYAQALAAASTGLASTGLASLRVASVATLAELGTPEEDIIGIDEGQFYPDLATACKQWALTKRVYVAALDGDFRQLVFPAVGALIPLADSVRKLTGVCMVCRDAPSVFSVRITGDTSLELIGGLDIYRAVCRACCK